LSGEEAAGFSLKTFGQPERGASMSDKGASIYLVDDDVSVRESVGSLIRSAGFRAETFASAQECLAGLQVEVPSCLVLDVQLPGLSGLDLQQQLAKADVQVPIIFLTGHGDIPMTVRAIKAGALECLTKPCDGDDLLNAIRQGIARRQRARQQNRNLAPDSFGGISASDELSDKLGQEKPYLGEEIRSEAHFEGIVGQSPALREVLQLVEMVAASDSTVLLLGETGTGKELIARAIHNRSPRKQRPFVKLNCAAVPSGLLESELFGHERGAFTGAVTQRAGRLDVADQGTLFLDEVGDIPLEIQPKLLRVLQEREFERLGSTRTKAVDVRIVAATHRALEEMIVEKQFRLDLYYRLNVFPIVVPPLRERPEDIPLLAQHFVQQFAQRMNKTIDAISSKTMEALIRYPWPGNIRELQNVIERSVIVHQEGKLSVKKSWLAHECFQDEPAAAPLNKRRATEQRKVIGAALAQARGRVSGPLGAAAKLGIPPSTLESKIRSMNINKYSFKTFSAVPT
jgi:DNA-binding NtrC family response regulator